MGWVSGFGVYWFGYYREPFSHCYSIIILTDIFLQFSVPVFPVLAPLSVQLTAPALAFYSFTRSFAQVLCLLQSTPIPDTDHYYFFADVGYHHLKHHPPKSTQEKTPSRICFPLSRRARNRLCCHPTNS